MAIKNRKQILVIAAALGIVGLLGDRLVFSPMVRKWRERSQQIVDLSKQVTQGSAVLERDATIRDRWTSMRTNTLPENVSAAENQLIQGFERWSKVSRISISSIKPQWKRAADDYMTLECHADAFGTIQALNRFLYELEKDSLALRVEAVEISARDNDGLQLGLGLQVSGLQLSTSTDTE